MKIILISPKGPLYRHRTGIFRKSLRTAPLTLTTLASLVPKELNAQVTIIDEGIEDIPDDLSADLIGMTVITGCANRTYELCERFRKKGIPVVLGGPHVTLVPDEATQHCDSIVTGYAEKSCPQLLKDLRNNKLKKRYAMSDDFSLSDIPSNLFPRRDLLAKKAYKSIHTFEATRGCIHSCNFCVVPTAWPKGPYQKPIEYIVQDIQQMKSKNLVFYDLNLLSDFNYAKKLFKALIPLKINWYGLCTTLIGKDEQLMDLIYKSGCKGLLIGFESLQQTGNNAMSKSFNDPENYRDLVLKLHQRNIALNGTFVFGNDEEPNDAFEQVYDFITETKIDLPRFSILTPFPNTPIYLELEKQNRITTKDWSLYDGQHLVFQPKGYSADELVYKHEELWRKTYSYQGIFSRFRMDLNGMFLRTAANIGYRFYANRLNQFYTCMGQAA